MNVGDASPVLPYIAPARETRSVSPGELKPIHNQPAHRQSARKSEPPEGVQPDLWQLLSEDEQAFLVQQLSLGPLTYGPNRRVSADASMPVGQRIDVKA